MRQADAPLQKITINIYKEDYEYLKANFGQDYSVQLREWINTEVRQLKNQEEAEEYERR